LKNKFNLYKDALLPKKGFQKFGNVAFVKYIRCIKTTIQNCNNHEKGMPTQQKPGFKR